MIGGYTPWFHEELARRVEKLIHEREDSLGRGAAGDFADYRFACGFFDGLRTAMELADEIKQDVERG
jgi:hypothetical protein